MRLGQVLSLAVVEQLNRRKMILYIHYPTRSNSRLFNANCIIQKYRLGLQSEYVANDAYDALYENWRLKAANVDLQQTSEDCY